MFELYDDIQELCAKIENSWLKYNYASEDFYKVAAELTGDIDLSPLGDLGNQMRLMDHPAVRLNQQPSTFSDLYFQLFNNGRFMIEILNWHGSHVNVHDHDFSGVQFQLKGRSLNVIYDFESNDRQGALRLGSLNVRRAEVWQPGGRSLIRPGAMDPHGVFHLSHPTTSLLIRTLPTPRLGVQTNYFPTVAGHYSVNTTLQRKKLTALALLVKQEPDEFRSLLENFLDTQSLAESFFMMVKLGPQLFQEEFVALMYAYAERGERESALVASVIANNGIDFFKSHATSVSNITEDEKLALSVVAASNTVANFKKIQAALADGGQGIDVGQNLQSFGRKIRSDEVSTANRYLSVLGMDEVLSV